MIWLSRAKLSNTVVLVLPKHSAWVTISDFLSDGALYVNGFSVTNSSLIKFIRNKLGGGGHYDEEDRARWQRELLEKADLFRAVGLLQDNVINYQIQQMMHRVLVSIKHTGLEEAVRMRRWMRR